jgi:tetratricopeptide (TPR) repeat protein
VTRKCWPALILLLTVVVEYAQADDIASLAVVYYNRGNAHYSNAEYDLAISDYNEAIRLAPTLAVTYAGRGTVYNATGSYELAIATTRRPPPFPELAPPTSPSSTIIVAMPTIRTPSTI